MSLTAIHEGINNAARVLDLDSTELRRVHEILDPQVVDLGSVHDESGNSFVAMDAFTPSFDSEYPEKCHGGNRMDDNYPDLDTAVDELRALTIEMKLKLALLGEYWGGRKGLILAPGKQLDFDQRKSLVVQYAGLMWQKGFAGHDKHVVSSDANTAGTCGAYALAVHELDPANPLWRASACGKEARFGGIPDIRRSSTSRGAIKATETHMRLTGREQADLVIKGLGQVGAWGAYEAGQSDLDMRVVSVGDLGGSIWTNHPDGITITRDMVETFGDNPSFSGDKIQALMSDHERLFPDRWLAFDPDPNACYQAEADYVIPCVLRDDVTIETARMMNVRVGIGEGGNNVTTLDAEQYLHEQGLIVIPDFQYNKTGVDGSIHEWHRNVRSSAAMQQSGEILNSLDGRQGSSIADMIEFAQSHGLQSYRVASTALAIRSLLQQDSRV